MGAVQCMVCFKDSGNILRSWLILTAYLAPRWKRVKKDDEDWVQLKNEGRGRKVLGVRKELSGSRGRKYSDYALTKSCRKVFLLAQMTLK